LDGTKHKIFDLLKEKHGKSFLDVQEQQFHINRRSETILGKKTGQ